MKRIARGDRIKRIKYLKEEIRYERNEMRKFELQGDLRRQAMKLADMDE